MRSIQIVFWILLVSLRLAAQTESSTPAFFPISGVVRNSRTGAAVPQVQLRLLPARGREPIAETTSGADGRFTFPRVPLGKFLLSADKKGFLSQLYDEHEGGYSTGLVTGPDFDLTGITFLLQPTSSIVGLVTDSFGDRVARGQVSLYEKITVNGQTVTRRSRQGGTDDEGSFQFAHLRPGTYYVAVRARPWYAQSGFENEESLADLDVAFPITFYPGVKDAASAQPIILRAGERISADFTLHAVPALRIDLNVPDLPMSENVLTRLDVTTFDSQVETFPAQIYRPRDGKLQIVGVAPGDYDLHFGKADSEQNYLEQQLSVSQSTSIDLEAPPAPISVIGIFRFNGPTPAAASIRDVQLEGANVRRIFSTPIASDGTFEFKNPSIRPGRYNVGVGPNRSGVVISSIAAEGARVLGHQVEITGLGPVTLAVQADGGVGSVSGSVKQKEKPVSGSMVLLIPIDLATNPLAIRRDQSDGDGSFELREVFPGQYVIVALRNGWDIEWQRPEVLNALIQTGQKLTVQARQSYKVKVEAQ